MHRIIKRYGREFVFKPVGNEPWWRCEHGGHRYYLVYEEGRWVLYVDGKKARLFYPHGSLSQAIDTTVNEILNALIVDEEMTREDCVDWYRSAMPRLLYRDLHCTKYNAIPHHVGASAVLVENGLIEFSTKTGWYELTRDGYTVLAELRQSDGLVSETMAFDLTKEENDA